MIRPATALFATAIACGPEVASVDREDRGTTDATSRDSLDSGTSSEGASGAGGASATWDGADELPPPDVPGFGCTLPFEPNAGLTGYASNGGGLDGPIAVRFAWYGRTGGGNCPAGHRVVITSVADEFENSFFVGWQYQALKIDFVIGDSAAQVAYEDWLHAHAIARVEGVGTVTARGGAGDHEPLAGSVSVDVDGLQAEGDFAAIHCPLLDAPPCP